MVFPSRDSTFNEEVYDGRDIDSFHRWWIMKIGWENVTEKVASKVRKVMLLTEKAHYLDARNNNTLYIYHLIRVTTHAISEVEKKVSPDRIIIRIAHDILEDHPEYWKETYEIVGLHIFRDILALATGGVKDNIFRKQMLTLFLERLSSLELEKNNSDKKSKELKEINREYHNCLDIVHILRPVDPLEKMRYFSKFYNNKYGDKSQDIQKMTAAIRLYKDKIILPKYKDKNKDLIDSDEKYLGLGNYLFFTEDNCRDKLADMLDNMRDMVEMEARRPGYIENRRIKAFILGVKLRNLGMGKEYSELKKAFIDKGYSMLEDTDVLTHYTL